MCTSIVGVCRVNLDDRCVYNECNAKEETTEDLQWSPTKRVDGHNADRCAHEGDNRVNSLEKQRATCRNPDLRKDLRREILNSTNTSHLAISLNSYNQNGTAEVWPATEEIEVCGLLLRSLFRDLQLNQVVFG